MRVNEVVRLEGKKLHEALEKENSTGVATANLVKIVEAHRADNWQRFETNEAFDAYLDSLAEK
jgi:uncharacterized protein (UPF0335 family)